MSMTARAERRAMLALVLVFSLLAQILAPAQAMAGPLGKLELCTSMGLQTVDAADLAPSGADPEHPCDHCVCAAPAAAAAPAGLAGSIVYDAAEAEAPAPRAGLQPRARAPPRPPGQGPPHSDA